jgi:hypothetical protein
MTKLEKLPLEQYMRDRCCFLYLCDVLSKYLNNGMVVFFWQFDHFSDSC